MMDTQVLTDKVTKVCQDLGLGDAAPTRIAAALAPDLDHLAHENQSLQAELQKIRAERDHLVAVHRELAELLGAKDPTKLRHDLRNVLNELNLLRAALGDEEDDN